MAGMLKAKRLWINGVELDLRTRSLRRDGQVVQLRAKTFDLLLFLIEHRDRLITKDELISQLWQGAPVTMDALVQTVLDLRRTLGDDAQNPRFIKTVPKAGYQLIAGVEEAGPEVEEETPPLEPVLPDIADWKPEASGVIAPDVPPAPRRWNWPLIVSTITVAVILVLLRPGLLNFLASSSAPEHWEVAWWKLDEGQATRISDSIHGMNAMLPSGVSWTQGVSGSALLFNGGELAVSGRDPGGALPRGMDGRTLVAWIKTKSTNGDSTTVFQYGRPVPHSGEDGFHLLLHESGVAGFGSNDRVNGQRHIDDDRWHQIAGIFEGEDSRRMTVLVDGVEEATSLHSPWGLKRSNDTQWTIGRATWGGTSFRGAIDDIRVFGRAVRPTEIQSLYRCTSGVNDIDIEGRDLHYFVPVFGGNVEILPRRDGESSAGARNTSRDYAGITFARRESDCPLSSAHGADMGQDLNIELELRVTPGPTGAVAEAGPYFRSRKANPGDGLIGGTSAGYWVVLESSGLVRVRRLHPVAIIAYSTAPEHFDPNIFHKIEVAVHGETLQVALDGRVLTFDVAGAQQSVLPIPPTWENASPPGKNAGNAGVAFGCPGYRGQVGGQEARNIRVKPYRSLGS